MANLHFRLNSLALQSNALTNLVCLAPWVGTYSLYQIPLVVRVLTVQLGSALWITKKQL